MSTVQIVAIAVAAVVVLLLVIALVVTRRRPRDDQAASSGEGSFLDAAPTDTLSGLGKPAAPAAEPEAPSAAPSEGPAAPGGADEQMWPNASPAPAGLTTPGGLGLDWGAGGGAAAAATASDAQLQVPPAAEGQETRQSPASEDLGQGAATAVPAAAEAPPGPRVMPAQEAMTASPAPPRDAAQAATAAPAAPPADEPPETVAEIRPPARRIPLSDILVTTSHKIVDLEDPEIRRMLTDLVKYEIEQATLFRRQGQDVDAVLQLTEAERISQALGMQETAQRIREMLRDTEH